MNCPGYTFFRVDRRYVKVIFREILYIESCLNFVKIKTKDKTHLVLITLRQLEQDLPQDLFCRVHRSFLIGIDHISSFDEDQVQLGDTNIPIGRSHRRKLESLLPVISCDIRPTQSVKRMVREMLQPAETSQTT